jgi:hypothetical protein
MSNVDQAYCALDEHCDGASSVNGKLAADPVGRLQAVGVEAKPAPVFL